MNPDVVSTTFFVIATIMFTIGGFSWINAGLPKSLIGFVMAMMAMFSAGTLLFKFGMLP